MLLQNRGALCWGSDVEQAYHRLETVEFCATVTFAAQLLGGAKEIPSEPLEGLLAARRMMKGGSYADGRHGQTRRFGLADQVLGAGAGEEGLRPADEDRGGVIARVRPGRFAVRLRPRSLRVASAAFDPFSGFFRKKAFDRTFCAKSANHYGRIPEYDE